MNNFLFKGRIKLTILFALIVITCFVSYLIWTSAHAREAHADTYPYDSVLTYTPINDTECNVRLSDITAKTAIISDTKKIDGKTYTVTEIVANGFASASNLKKVRLPQTVKIIGQSAFSNCTSLTSITLPAVESIGTNAFANTNLDYLIIPPTITTVAPTILRNTSTSVYVMAELAEGKAVPNGTWATNWNGYNEIQDVEFGSTFTPDVKFIHISELLEEQGISYFGGPLEGYVVEPYQEFCAYKNDPVEERRIPAIYNGQPVIGIAQDAFYDNYIGKLIIEYSEDAINIQSRAFNDLKADEIIIDRDVTFVDEDWVTGETIISENVFAKSSVKTIYLPNEITEIGSFMFMGCSNLTDIHFIDVVQDLDKIYQGSTANVKLPNTVNTIGDEAFSGISHINQLFIPHQVKTVGSNILNGWNSKYGQTVIIDYDKESDLPNGWNELWKGGCDSNVIRFNGNFKITYILNGGTHSGNPTEYNSSNHYRLNNAYLEGNTFEGWFDNEDFKGNKWTEIVPGTSGDLTLYAKFTPNEYKIFYDSNKPEKASNDVLGVTVETTLTYGKKTELRPNGFSLVGWGFNGWNTQPDGTGKAYDDREQVKNLTAEPQGIVTLYAQWEPSSYNIVFNPNKPNIASGLLSGSMENASLLYDVESRNLNANLFKLAGWHFVCWSTQADGKGSTYADKEVVSNLIAGGTITLYAQWSPNSYTVIYDSNKPTTASGEITGSMENSDATYEMYIYLHGNSYDLTGWTSTGWNTKPNGTGQKYENNEYTRNITEESECKLYAQWTQNEYTVKYHYGTIPNSEYGNLTKSVMESTHHIYDTASPLNSDVFILTPPTGVKYAIQEVVGWALNIDGPIEYKVDEEIKTGTPEDGGTLDLYAVWDFVKYTIYKPSIAVGFDEPIYWRRYTYVESVTIDNTSSNGIYYQYSINYIPKGTTGDIVITWTKREVKYTLNYYVNGTQIDGKIVTLQEKKVYELNYSEERTFTASDIVGYAFTIFRTVDNNNGLGNSIVTEYEQKEITLSKLCQYEGFSIDLICSYHATATTEPPGGTCVAEGTFITLADGSQKLVEDLKGDEMLLVWNLYTGTFDAAPILFIDSEPIALYEVINLYFSDGTEVKVITEHAFWDFDLNEYVYLRSDAEQYIGHWFNKQVVDDADNISWTMVQLINVTVREEITTAWSPVTYGHLCYYVNGMLSMPGGTEGFSNIFDVDSKTLAYNADNMAKDIEQYGLFTYEEFAEILPVPEEIFNAFGGQYLKVSMGKGLINWETLNQLVERYSKFF